MGKKYFLALHFLSPAIPAAVYLIALGAPVGLYSLSVVCGVAAFIYLCNQYLLASRPAFAMKALGAKGLVALHSAMPIVIVALAIAHRFLKAAAGFDTESLQAEFGAAALAIVAAAIVFTVLLMAATPLSAFEPLKRFKAWVYRRAGLDYKKARLIHNITVAAAPLLLAHVLLAGSGSFSINPAGAMLLAGWAAVSLAAYARYRIRGRNQPATSRPSAGGRR